MLENSLWLRYNPDTSIQDVLVRIYGCEPYEIESDERLLYASLKRHLTKKELRIVMMSEANMPEDEISKEVSLDSDGLKKAKHKAYRKIRQEKIRFEVRANKVEEETPQDDEE